ncbi:MAG TPA: hypothetical protein VFB60_00600 [Ktedonobacteraceae bacterium]|nr:hypothetical protein [Ktedonobacteraceae bacterium]
MIIVEKVSGAREGLEPSEAFSWHDRWFKVEKVRRARPGLESVDAQQRIAGEQGKREAPSQAHPPPLAPTVPPHDCLSRHLLAPTDHVVGSASIPERIRTDLRCSMGLVGAIPCGCPAADAGISRLPCGEVV